MAIIDLRDTQRRERAINQGAQSIVQGFQAIEEAKLRERALNRQKMQDALLFGQAGISLNPQEQASLETGDYAGFQPVIENLAAKTRKKEKDAAAREERKLDIEERKNGGLGAISKETKENVMKLQEKRESLDKEFRPFERLYGSIGVLRDKFKANPRSLNPQERVQLVRLLVPLSEINPGVVREGEVNLVNNQQSALNKIKSYFTQNVRGEQITDKVISEMFTTADTLKPVVGNIKIDAIGNIDRSAKYFGLDDKARNVVLGDKNVKLLSRPDSFAVFGEKKKDEGYSYDRLTGIQEQKIPLRPMEPLNKLEVINRNRQLPGAAAAYKFAIENPSHPDAPVILQRLGEY